MKRRSLWQTVDISLLLDTYPRERPPLSPAHERIFAKEYRLNREGSAVVEGLAKRLEGWMHRRVAAARLPGDTLELGAGTLNHLRYESAIRDYDIVEPFRDLFVNSNEQKKVRKIYSSQDQISGELKYGRIISVAVLEHMTDLPKELAISGLLLTENGVFQAGIPCEGGLLWWLGWRCTTGLTYWLRNHLDYGMVMRHEHVNRADEIIALCRYFFKDVKVSRFPLPFGNQLSLYAYIVARAPITAICRKYMAERN